MYISKVFSYLAICLLLSSCGRSEKKCNPEKHLVKIKGTQKTVRIVDECDNNRVISETSYLIVSKDSTIVNGRVKQYYPDGSLKIKAIFKNGIQDGEAIQYFPNQKIQHRTYLFEGHMFGPQYTYFENGGKTISFYLTVSPFYFKIDFGRNDSIIGLYGKPLFIQIAHTEDTVHVGRNLKIINVPAVIDDIKTIVNATISKNDKVLKQVTIDSFACINNIHLFEFEQKITSPGEYKYLANVKLIDKRDQHLIKEDTLVRIIRIK